MATLLSVDNNKLSRKRKTHVVIADEEKALSNFLFGNQDIFSSSKNNDEIQAPAIDEESTQQPPAWHDSDDENLEVSLANTNRLKKLRSNDTEKSVKGVEFETKLRRQVLHLIEQLMTDVGSLKKQIPPRNGPLI